MGNVSQLDTTDATRNAKPPAIPPGANRQRKGDAMNAKDPNCMGCAEGKHPHAIDCPHRDDDWKQELPDEAHWVHEMADEPDEEPADFPPGYSA
jgi:hypothetical protein